MIGEKGIKWTKFISLFVIRSNTILHQRSFLQVHVIHFSTKNSLQSKLWVVTSRGSIFKCVFVISWTSQCTLPLNFGKLFQYLTNLFAKYYSKRRNSLKMYVFKINYKLINILETILRWWSKMTWWVGSRGVAICVYQWGQLCRRLRKLKTAYGQTAGINTLSCAISCLCYLFLFRFKLN